MVNAYTEVQLDRAAKAVHEVTGGGIPYGRGRRSRVTVNARAVAQAALDAATMASVIVSLPVNGETTN